MLIRRTKPNSSFSLLCLEHDQSEVLKINNKHSLLVIEDMEKQLPNPLSEQLLLTVKKQQDTTALQEELAKISLPGLRAALADDDHKKAFWINVYNAYYQILRIEKSMDKPDIYRKRAFSIAGEPFSLDDVEHGILRKFRYKYSLGYLANPFTSRLIKDLAVDELDYRIHFTLNCGAKSCPPIAFYKVKNINSQLDLATQAFLEGETDYDDVKWWSAPQPYSNGLRGTLAAKKVSVTSFSNN